MRLLKRAPIFPPIFSKVGKARVYRFEDRYFVCSVAGIAETDSITILPQNVDDLQLGEAILKHLMEYDAQDSRDATQSRSKDWRAFIESGATSIKTFEPHLWHVDASIENGNVNMQAQPRLTLKDHLSVQAFARCNFPNQVGEALREAIQGAQALRDRGLI